MTDAYVRLRFEAPPSAEQVRGLRRLFPELSSQPPAMLMQRLRSCAEVVVATIGARRVEEVRSELSALEIQADLYGTCDYGADYLRGLLAAPPAWDEATERGEFVFIPSFSPEVVLRMWKQGTTGRAHLIAPSASVFLGHFNVARWLTTEAEIPDQGKKVDESLIVDGVDEVLGHTLPPAPAEYGGSYAIADGMQVDVRLETSLGQQACSYPSPTADHIPNANVFLNRVLDVYRSLNGLESHRRLAELRRALND